MKLSKWLFRLMMARVLLPGRMGGSPITVFTFMDLRRDSSRDPRVAARHGRRGRRGMAAALAGLSLLGVGASHATGAEPLRILPIGDSITWGWGAESTYGYRGPLADLLDSQGVAHEFVGTLTDEFSSFPRLFNPPLDPPIRQLVGSAPHYSIPGANADEVDGNGFSENNRGSLLWSIRNDVNGDEVSDAADAAFVANGGLIPTLVDQGQRPDAVLLHLGTNAISRSFDGVTEIATTPGTGVERFRGANNAADAQLFRFLEGLGQDLTSEGLITGSADDTQIVLAKIVPRPVWRREKPRGPRGTVGIDWPELLKTLDYNDAVEDVVSELSTLYPAVADAITVVDMFAVDLTDPTLLLGDVVDDGVFDQPFDSFTGNDQVFNEAGQTVGGQLAAEGGLSGPDYADWLLRYDESLQTFYDDAFTDNDQRWNAGLYGVEANGEFYDAIHPNANGYTLMAHVWYQALAALFAEASVPGDFSGDGTVEQADLDLVLANWGSDTTGAVPAGWLNTQGLLGAVDQAELDLVLSHWGASESPSIEGGAALAGAVVPEPGGMLVLWGLAGLLGMRGSRAKRNRCKSGKARAAISR